MLAHQRCRGCPGRAIGDVLGLVGKALCVGGKPEILHHLVFVGSPIPEPEEIVRDKIRDCLMAPLPAYGIRIVR